MTNYIKLTCSQFSPDPKPVKSEKKKRTPIKKVSAKRDKENKAYLTLRKVFLENHKTCQVNQDGRSVEVHHTYSGKDRDKHFLDVKTWLAVCRGCHNWIHKNPLEARKLGYLK